MNLLNELLTSIRACLRLALVVGVLLLLAAAVLLIIWVPPGAPRRAVAQRVARWASRSMLHALGLSRHVYGDVPASPALLVANHMSWLDIPIALASWPCAFVAKREVRGWPVIGTLAEELGVIWIDRSRLRDVRRVVPLVASTLRGGTSVLLFPEGTTTSGRSVLPFRSALFESAKLARVGVVTIAYQDGTAGGNVDALSWCGSETLWANIRRVAALRCARMILTVDTPSVPVLERKAAARIARITIATRLAHSPRSLPAARPAVVRPTLGDRMFEELLGRLRRFRQQRAVSSPTANDSRNATVGAARDQ